MQQHFFSIRKPLCAFPCFMLQLIFAGFKHTQEINDGINRLHDHLWRPQNLGTNYPVVGKTLAIEKAHVFCIFFAWLFVYFMVLPQLKLGNSPPVFSGAKENFSRLLPSVRDEMMPQLMKEQPGKNHGKTMGKPWENQHGTRNAHKKDIKSNPEGLQGLQLRTLTFSI